MGKKISEGNLAVTDLTPRNTKDVKGGKIAEVLARRARLQEARAGLATTSGWKATGVVNDLPPRKGQDVKGGMLYLNGTTASSVASNTKGGKGTVAAGWDLKTTSAVSEVMKSLRGALQTAARGG